MKFDLIDIGANLTHDSFDEDRAAVIRRAADAGVGRLILTGSSVECSRAALQLARQWPDQLYSTAGVHPHHATDYTTEAHETLRRLTDAQEVVAVGECGLDYFRNFSPADAQRHAFQRQLALAVETQSALFLHQREAHDDFVRILKPVMPDIPRAVAHCFTGSENELLCYLEMGLYIGITGWICDERRGAHLKEIVRHIPLQRLMIETDAPYLLPRTVRPKPKSRRNEPQYLPAILQVLAEAMQQDESTLARYATENSERFFAIA